MEIGGLARQRRYLVTFGLMILMVASFYTLGLMVGRTYAIRLDVSEPGQTPATSTSDVRGQLTFYDTVNQDQPVKPPVDQVPAPATAISPEKPPVEIYLTVQVAASTNRQDAETVQAKLEEKHYQARILDPSGGPPAYFRVVIGQFTDREQASRMQARLRNDGFNGFVKTLP